MCSFLCSIVSKKSEMDLERRKKLLACLALILKIKRDKRLKKSKRKIWVKEIFRQREHEGAFTLTIQKLRVLNDKENFFR